MSQIRKRLNENGFTLLEILIVMVIATFVLLATFELLDTNYRTVNNEKNKNELRDELKIFTSFLVQDLMYSKKVEVFHSDTYDMLYYQQDDLGEVGIKFDYAEGIFELVNGEEKLVATGERIYSEYPMVREENGLIIFNFYAKSINAAFDFSLQPRRSE